MKKFKTEILHRNKLRKINDIQDINFEIAKLTHNIKQELKNSSYTIKNSFTIIKLPEEIQLEIETKRLFRKTWQQTSDPQLKELEIEQMGNFTNL